MSEKVTVPFAGKASDRAVLLLAAAQELDLDASVVQTSDGAFVVPQEVADQAGVEYGSALLIGTSNSEPSEEPEQKAPAKKTAAKKAPAKKTAAKKTASKKE